MSSEPSIGDIADPKQGVLDVGIFAIVLFMALYIFGLISLWKIVSGFFSTIWLIIIYTVLYILCAGLGGIISTALRIYALPSFVFADGMKGLLKARFFWSFGPQSIGIAIGFFIALVIMDANFPNHPKTAVSKSVPSASAVSEQNTTTANQSSQDGSNPFPDASKSTSDVTPPNSHAYKEKGNEYLKIGNYTQAIESYNKAIAMDITNETAYNNRGLAYKNLGNHQQAIVDYNKAIELNPKYIDAYVNRANINDSIGKHAQAKVDLKMAARLGDKETQEYLTKKGIDW